MGDADVAALDRENLLGFLLAHQRGVWSDSNMGEYYLPPSFPPLRPAQPQMPKIIKCALAVCVSWPALHAQQPAASAHRPRVAAVRSPADSLAEAFVAAGSAAG